MLPSNFNFQYIERVLHDYGNKKVIDFMKYGFPIDCKPGYGCKYVQKNHKGATDFLKQVQCALDKEVKLGGILGPFKSCPFKNPSFNPLNSVLKKNSVERCLILDLSMLEGISVNDGIDKDNYLGVNDKLELPSIDKLVEKIVSIGVTAKLFKIDLSRAYKQMYIDPMDFELMGFVFNQHMYFDCTLSMGSRSSARCCQMVTSVVVFAFRKENYFAINYLDDLGGCEQERSVQMAYNKLHKILASRRQ